MWNMSEIHTRGESDRATCLKAVQWEKTSALSKKSGKTNPNVPSPDVTTSSEGWYENSDLSVVT